MGKIRVHELAKELGLENKVVIARLNKIGISVASHSNSIDDVDADNLRIAVEKEKKGAEPEKKAPAAIIRRRAKKEEPAPEAAGPETVQPPLAPPETATAAAIAEMDAQAQAEAAAPPAAEAPAQRAQEAHAQPVRERKPGQPPPPKPKKESRIGLQIVGPPIPLKDLQARGGLRQPAAVEEKPRPGLPPSPAEVPAGPKKAVVEEVIKPEKEKEKGLKKKVAARRMKELDRREIFSDAETMFGGYRMKKKVVKRNPAKTEITTPKAIKRVVRMDNEIMVGEFARQMGVKAGEIIKKLIGLGVMATINNAIDFDTATVIAHDYEWEIKRATEDMEQQLEQKEPDAPEALRPRPPIVTVMGHVDHGKTSLLDAIRSTNKVEQEAGGITQHIGAYRVATPRGSITFLDTPGHEAFTEMRARGAKITDLVILVVAADDGIQPQTVEAINHAREAGVPLIVAINKIDKPNAVPDRVKQSLTEHGLVAEEWGGDTLITAVSAKQKTGIDALLEQVVLQAEMLELQANPDKPAKGLVIESRLDRGLGPVVTVIIEEGTLRAGDPIVSGQYFGRVRTMFDENGGPVTEAGPSTPVEVIGLNGVPMAGDPFNAVQDERLARDVAEKRALEARQSSLAKDSKLSLENLLEGLKEGEVKTFKVVLKADVQGSVAPISDALAKMSTDKVKIKIIHSAVGGITGNDISLASASGAVVIGFNVRPETSALDLASKSGVDVRTYNVIYELIDEVRKAAAGLLGPRLQEKYLGRAEVRQIFNLPKVGTVAGCAVIDGKVARSSRIRLLRDSTVVYTGKLGSLKHFKDDAREITAGNECGLSLDNFSDVKPGDVVEAFEIEELAQTL